MTAAFGRALAEQSADPLVWREPVMAAAEIALEKERSFSLLAGYFQGLSERDAAAVETFKMEASQSAVFAPALPPDFFVPLMSRSQSPPRSSGRRGPWSCLREPGN